MRKNDLQELLGGDDVLATTVVVWATDTALAERWDRQWWDWHPSVLRDLLGEQLGTPLSDDAVDRLMAGLVIRHTDRFHREARTFADLANVLSGQPYRPDVFEPPTAIECAWALTEAGLLYQDDDPNPYSEEVVEFIRHVLQEHGVLLPPDVLGIAGGPALAQRVVAEWNDDPELLAEIAETQGRMGAGMRVILKQGLEEIRAQIRSLPLRVGSVEALEERLSSRLEKL